MHIKIVKFLKKHKKHLLAISTCNNPRTIMLEDIHNIPIKRLIKMSDGNCEDVLFFKKQADTTPRTVGVNPYNRTPLKDETKKKIIKKLKELGIYKLTNGIRIDNMFKQDSPAARRERQEREEADRRRARRQRTAAWNAAHPAETWQEQQEREEDEEQAEREGWYD